MLVKHEIPILEYDTEKMAVIMPGHHTDYQLPRKAVMAFMNEEIDGFVAQHQCKEIGKFESITKWFPVYHITHQKQELCLCQAPLGGAAAVQIMEQLAAGGVREIIAVGCCGSLVEDAVGDFYIPTAALRQEGTSYLYLAPSREVEINKKAIDAIVSALNQAGYTYQLCRTWTTDGFYRETKEMVQYRKEEGYSVVEMECASLAACAKMREIMFGQMLFTADSLANIEQHDTRDWGKDTFELALNLAIDAAVLL